MKWGLASALLLVAVAAPAYEGEAHGAVPAAAPPVPARHTMTAVSPHFELVVKNKPLQPGTPAHLDIYLNAFDTNAPIAGAAIQLRLRAGSREIWSGGATPEPTAGVYTATFTPADTGRVNTVATVTVSGIDDEFVLAGLEIGTHAEVATVTNRSPARLWPWIGLGALLVAGALALWSRSHRRRLRSASTLLLVAGLAAVAPRAVGHEGHDEGPVSSGLALQPGSEVYLAKDSQFLLGVLTQSVAPESVRNHLRVQGRVAPRNGGELDLMASQAGRIEFPRARTPGLGQRVARGQVLATLVVVDSLPLRAALGGVITEVAVANGQLVEPGQKLLHVLDTSVVWVHADVYERDLESVERSTTARIVSPAYPERVFIGHRVALGSSLGEVQGTVESYFEVPNPQGALRVGMLVDVDIDQGGIQSAFIVPRAALVEKDGRQLVFVHTKPERFAAREVHTVANLGERVAVQGDLKAGDRVVIAGSYQLLGAPVTGD